MRRPAWDTECAGAPELHEHQDAAQQAAVADDRETYFEALRAYMRAGRDEALRVRKGAA